MQWQGDSGACAKVVRGVVMEHVWIAWGSGFESACRNALLDWYM